MSKKINGNISKVLLEACVKAAFLTASFYYYYTLWKKERGFYIKDGLYYSNNYAGSFTVKELVGLFLSEYKEYENTKQTGQSKKPRQIT